MAEGVLRLIERSYPLIFSDPFASFLPYHRHSARPSIIIRQTYVAHRAPPVHQ